MKTTMPIPVRKSIALFVLLMLSIMLLPTASAQEYLQQPGLQIEINRSSPTLASALLTHGSQTTEYSFRLHNQSTGWTINGFYTYQNGEWSQNWLKKKIVPGRYMTMLWNSAEGACVVPFRVSWDDYGSEDFSIDWCKGVKNVYMKDKGFTSN